MKIAMMTNNYKPVVGGVPVSIERLSGALRRRGHDVTIFAPHCAGEELEEGVVRYRSKDKNLPGGVVLPDPTDPVIGEYFRRESFDLIHVHHPMMIGYTGLYLSRRYGIPVALTHHTRYEQYLHHAKPYAMLQRWHLNGACHTVQRAVGTHNRLISNNCDLVFAPTPMIRDYLRENGTASPIEVLPTGLDDGDFRWDRERAGEIRRQYVGDGRQLFCSVSRLEREKNIPFLLQSLARYKRQYGGQFRLLLIGEGTQKEELQRLATALGLGEEVVFTGGIDHDRLSDYYRACDLFLFASRSETQGIVLLEAMAAGLPVVAVDASGVCDVVKDGQNGWKTLHDQQDFARRLHNVMTGTEARAEMAKGAEITARRYTAQRTAEEAEWHYFRMLEQRQTRPVVGWRQHYSA